MKFKPGDKVRCTHGQGKSLIKGSEWEFVKYYQNGGYFGVLKNSKGQITEGWCDYRFELISTSNPRYKNHFLKDQPCSQEFQK